MKLFNKYRIALTPQQKKERKKDLLLGILSGVLLGLSYPPFPLPFLSFFAFIPFFFVMEKKETLASLNRFTYFTLFFFNLITLYWVGSWTKEADTFLMISGAALLFFNPFFYLVAFQHFITFRRKRLVRRLRFFYFHFTGLLLNIFIALLMHAFPGLHWEIVYPTLILSFRLLI